MSSYERYDETARHYDRTRVAVGTEILLGAFARQGRPLAELRVLDAGCGTGAYSQAVLPHVGRIEAVDLSAGMLAAARVKLGGSERIAFRRAAIDALPFADGAFDAVMVNQVLHHLPDDAEFARHRRVVAELARVLAPGGVLVINSCSQAQLAEAYWYYHLAPAAAAAMAARFCPLERLRAFCADAGLAHRGAFVPIDAVCQGAAYFDPRGPLEKAWRDGDSFWALVDAATLAEATERVRAMAAEGTLADFVARHDARRPELGQITLIAAARG